MRRPAYCCSSFVRRHLRHDRVHRDLGLKARDIMGYTFTMFLACFPAALIAVTLLAPQGG